MSTRKIRWSKVYESTEEELNDFLRARNIQAVRIAAEAMSEQLQQKSQQDITIWCAEGSLNVGIGPANTSLQPGDALHIDASTPYDLRAGISGYVCYISS
jgi:quercetin dioxygenase-like cupin family protein